ncbi:MAG: transglutaminase-like domain-containing protein [Candidatus Micrarchaeota archaeon]
MKPVPASLQFPVSRQDVKPPSRPPVRPWLHGLSPRFPALIFLLLLPISFSTYTGYMAAEFEKEWNIVSNGTLRDAVLNATFLVESPFQRIIQINLSDGEAVRHGDEIRIIYRSANLSTPKKITAVAVVETRYMPDLSSNPPLPNASIPGTTLTTYTTAMAAFARSHTAESSGQLEAAAVLTDWVHRNVEYDEDFWGDDAPAEEVYAGRRAVCVGYTHLLISLARSLGIGTRYVSGYVFSGDGWQEHAWAELDMGGQWVPSDPTFRELGNLDARRIAGTYSLDQSGAADRLTARGGPFSFDTVARIRILQSGPFPPVSSAYAAFDGTEFSVVISNPGANYLTPTYIITFPPYVHGEESGILFLPPGGRKALSYALNLDSLGSGTYSVPYLVSTQGTEISDSITVSRSQPPVSGSPGSAACPVAAVLVSTFLLVVAKSRK